MSVRTETDRRQVVRPAARGRVRVGRGAWLILVVALVLLVGATVALLWPSGGSETSVHVSGGPRRVEVASATTASIWGIKAAQAGDFTAPRYQVRGSETSAPAAFDPSAEVWLTKRATALATSYARTAGSKK